MHLIAGSVLLLFLFSCASQPGILEDTSRSGVIVTRVDTGKQKISIFIDGKAAVYRDAGGEHKEIAPGAMAGYALSNGTHSIYAYNSNNIRSTVINFTINNDRHYFSVWFNDVDNKQSLMGVLAGRSAPVDSVVLREDRTESRTEPSRASDLDTVIKTSFTTISAKIPKKSTVAILDVSSRSEPDTAEFISEELTLLFVNASNYQVVDRQQTLNAVRTELMLQTSGEVSDESAVSIGNFLGANIVVAGAITGEGSQRRLRLRALDVKTAQILAASSEQL
ncbi:hypothetical protein FACS1894172_06510 [Spirochaetia bacterium]|nr:hypothetical protein FACS1894164_11350 [Spirochaetia bacterium]GHU31500.1 hypothetical protein FACS1894172_06510 [Spirochaetia bacterium]